MTSKSLKPSTSALKTAFATGGVINPMAADALNKQMENKNTRDYARQTNPLATYIATGEKFDSKSNTYNPLDKGETASIDSTVAPVTAQPTADEAQQALAKKRAAAAQKARKGRASTILSQGSSTTGETFG